MWKSSIFQISKQPTPEIIDLLCEVTLGTTGVRYKHLDTPKRIQEVDNPLFFYLKRREKVLGNITFCQRNDNWYIRYFAFRPHLQRSSETKTEDKTSSLFKKEIEGFFLAAFNGEIKEEKVNNFYAFIDPKNDRSKWMSKNFNFNTIAQLSTQTFSRWFAKQSKRFYVHQSPTEEDILRIKEHFSSHRFFFDYYLDKNPIAFIKDNNGEILAYARLSKAHWEIESLGGKFGVLKAKILSHTPIINSLVQPKLHTFSVPDTVYVKNNDPKILQELFESIIAFHKSNMLIWWTDQKEPLYQAIKTKTNWGPLNTILGVSPVDVVFRNKDNKTFSDNKPIYVVGIDAI